MPSLPPFAAICFDCDSTLSSIEGIDELALRAGCGPAIIPLTTAAMEGRLALEEVYARRLALIRPDRTALDWAGRRYIETIVPGAGETVATLMGLGKAVHIVSGGLRQPIAILAARLGIPGDCVHAVAVRLAADGSYEGYDTGSPLARAGGKAAICRDIAARFGAIAMVGDGVTDLEAHEGGAYVVGFGGVVARPAVIAGADVFIHGPALTATLSVLLSPEERGLATR